MLGDFNRCTVVQGLLSNSKNGRQCFRKRCKKHSRFMIFGDDGIPKMSRFEFQSCRVHLSEAVDLTWENNFKSQKKYSKKKSMSMELTEHLALFNGLDAEVSWLLTKKWLNQGITIPEKDMEQQICITEQLIVQFLYKGV